VESQKPRVSCAGEAITGAATNGAATTTDRTDAAMSSLDHRDPPILADITHLAVRCRMEATRRYSRGTVLDISSDSQAAS
jgi:hypothetical protein